MKVCTKCGIEKPLSEYHKTGRVRGLACHSCNAAIGYVGDDPELLRRMIDYLEKSNEVPIR